MIGIERQSPVATHITRRDAYDHTDRRHVLRKLEEKLLAGKVVTWVPSWRRHA
jgi:hypothetical protein